MIIEAIKIGGQRNVHNAKYISGILNDWKSKNYKVKADIQSNDFKRILGTDPNDLYEN